MQLGGDAQIGRGFAAILAHAHIELDDIAFFETLKAGLLHFRNMDENVFRRTIRRDETVSLHRIKPLHCSTHVLYFLYSMPAPYGWAALSGKLLWRLAQPVAGSEHAGLAEAGPAGQLETVIAQFARNREKKGAGGE